MEDKNEHFVEDELAKFSRRLDSIQKTIDLLFADREILENIQGRLTGLEEQVKLARMHDNEVRKDIKDEIQTSGQQVVATVETKIDEIKSKAKVISKKRRSLWERLKGVK